MFFDIQTFIIALVSLWIGSGIIVTTVDKMAKRLNMSSFLISFFVLGAATSTPEISVGINAILSGAPQLFVGNYVGGSLVILLFIIPLLAIIGNGVDLRHQISPKNLILTLSVIALPVILTLDQRLTYLDAFICLIGFAGLYFFIKPDETLADRFHIHHLFKDHLIFGDLVKVLAGTGLVFIASNRIVSETTTLAQMLNLSPFVIGLLMLSFGTNLPETSIAAKSAILRKKAVAFGNYLGSSAFNTLLLGIMVILAGGDIVIENHAIFTLSIFLVGLTLFYLFAKSKRFISRKEGLILISLYLLIAFLEIYFNTR
jgi:cation:H+ antiporter